MAGGYRRGRMPTELNDLIDELDDIETFETSPMPHTPPAHGRWGRAADGIVVRDGEPLLILDLARLVPQGSALVC